MAKAHSKPISKRPPVERNAKPVSPDKSPPTEEVIAEALQELNPQEIEFCEVYLTCYNGTKAPSRGGLFDGDDQGEPGVKQG